MKAAVLDHLSVSAASNALLFNDREIALLAMGQYLRAHDYHFTTVTPETHKRVLKRKTQPAYTELRDIFGWTRPFRIKAIPEDLRDLMKAAKIVQQNGALAKSAVRYSTIGDELYVHSAYPTVENDAVFFGPDTHRFLQFITSATREISPGTIVDIGTGSGAAAIHLSRLFPRANVIATDINDTALRFTAVNAALNGTPMIDIRTSDITSHIPTDIDLIVANPPYLIDTNTRRYRHGGGATGSDLSLRILKDAAANLSKQGRLLLYTGTAITDGRDDFRIQAEAILQKTPWQIREYREIDPDVFGEELNNSPYHNVDRIAVVGMTVTAK
jgi:methylase of polypeptide subunit release factors